MNKKKKIEMIIFEVLKDKEWHSVREMKCRIKEVDETLLLKENYIYVILKRLEKQKKIIRCERKWSISNERIYK